MAVANLDKRFDSHTALLSPISSLCFIACEVSWYFAQKMCFRGDKKASRMDLRETYTYGYLWFRFHSLPHSPYIQMKMQIQRSYLIAYGVNENLIKEWSLTPIMLWFMGLRVDFHCMNKIEKHKQVLTTLC